MISRSSTLHYRSTSLDSSEDEVETFTEHKKFGFNRSTRHQPSIEEDKLYEDASSTQKKYTGYVRTEISKEALDEIEAFKQFIKKYFAEHPDEEFPKQYRMV